MLVPRTPPATTRTRWARPITALLAATATVLACLAVNPAPANATTRAVSVVDRTSIVTLTGELADDTWTGSFSVDRETSTRDRRIVSDLRRAWIQVSRRWCEASGRCIEEVRRVTSTTATPVVDARLTQFSAATMVATMEVRRYRVDDGSYAVILDRTTTTPLQVVAAASGDMLVTSYTERDSRHRTTGRGRQVAAVATAAWAGMSLRTTSATISTSVVTTTTTKRPVSPKRSRGTT